MVSESITRHRRFVTPRAIIQQLDFAMSSQGVSARSGVAMSGRIRSKIATRAHRLLPVRLVRRFARRQDGSAAIEFAFIAAPFIALTFAILETALVFFAGQTLETAVSEAGRLIMT
ncbi:MAG TPA: TadE/TadG family type IV pilus assembly protein, partial [Pseudolabrys sp.]